MKLEKSTSLIIGLAIAIIGIILSSTYRVYIYENDLNDFHLADTIGSLICVPSSVLVFYSITNKQSVHSLIIYNSIGFILYEILSLSKLHGTFNLYDICAIITGAVFTYFTLNVYKVFRKKRKIKKQGL